MKFTVQDGHPACLLDRWAVVGEDGEAYACASGMEAAEVTADRYTQATEDGDWTPKALVNPERAELIAATAVNTIDELTVEQRVARFQTHVDQALRRAIRAGTRSLGEVVTAAGDPEHTGAMLALVPEQREVDRLVLEGGEPPEELHLTLWFLGDADQMSDELVQALRRQLDTQAPNLTLYQGNAFSVNQFNPNGDDPALVLGIGGAWLPEVRDVALRALADALVEASSEDWQMPENHQPWVPHVTLAYQPTDQHLSEAAERLGPIMFDRLRFAHGGDTYDFPFGRSIVAAAQPAGVSLDDLSAIEQAWRVELISTLLPEIGLFMQDGARDTLTVLVDYISMFPVSFSLSSTIAEVHLMQAENRLVGIGDDLWRRTRLGLLDGIGLGEDIDQLARRVREVLASTRVRAQTVARTEVVGAYNAGAFAQVQMLGEQAPQGKEWLATNDDRTRDTHRRANGQQVGLLEPFEVGDGRLKFPGDPDGPAEEVINCRCTVLWVFSDEQQQEVAVAAAGGLAAPSLVEFHLPGKHDQQRHAGGRGRKQEAPSTSGVAEGDAALDAAPFADSYGYEGAYQSFIGWSVNAQLRKDTDSDQYPDESSRQTNDREIADLDAAFDQAPALEQSIRVQRGMNGASEVFGEVGTAVGGWFRDPAYTSTTTDTTVAGSYAQEFDGAVVNVTVPAGKKALTLSRRPAGEVDDWGFVQTEDGTFGAPEILLPRGSMFTITGDRIGPDGIRVVDLEVM